MNKYKSIIFLLFILPFGVYSQTDSSFIKRISADTSINNMNMDAVYNRPFLGFGKMPVSLGGYMEVNWQHLGTDGVSEGHQFQARRLTLFVASSIGKRLKFLTEIEFEDGGKEIAIEFASLDVEIHPLLNLRGGIIINPIGAFNQNHDGPKWEFTDRPFSATQLLPATWSNPGFGIYGKYYLNDWMLGYEAYISGGFDPTIIDNESGKTFLAAAKDNPERFNEGNMLMNGKIAVKNSKIGELGISYMGGIYNKFKDDGIVLDKQRWTHSFVIDFNTVIPKINTKIITEWAWIFVDVPGTYTQQYGNRQQGGFIDIVQPLFTKKIFGQKKATLNLACRVEYVDWNIGQFRENNENIAEDIWSIMPGISFRLSAQTVIRLNYRFMKNRDILGNPPATTGGFILGLSSYF